MTQLAHSRRASHGVHRWYAAQVTASCKVGDCASALQLLRNMHQQKMQPTAATCNKIVMACIESKELDSALIALGLTRAMDVVPDANIYSTLIRICEKRGLAETAWQLFEDVKKNDLATNVITYNALIRAAEELNMTFAHVYQELLTHMKGSQVALDINSYNALISVSLADSSRQDNIQLAIDLFVELHQLGLSPNVITYKTLFGVIREDTDGSLTEGIFTEMERRGILPDINTYNSLISSCERGKHPERALVLFNALHRQGLRPDRATYNALLAICRKKKQPERAARILASMQEAGIDPDVNTFNLLIGACGRKDQAELAIQHFRDLQANGLEPNISTFTAVFATVIRREVSGESLDRLVESMACYGLKPDRTIYGHLLTACVNNDDSQRALKWLQMMRSDSIDVDGEIQSIISGLDISCDFPQEEVQPNAVEEAEEEQFVVATKMAVEAESAVVGLPPSWKLFPVPHKAPPGLTPQFPLEPPGLTPQFPLKALQGYWYVAQQQQL